MNDDRYTRHYQRLKTARKEAESLLETKSRELFEANQMLTKSKVELEMRVQERTLELEQALKDKELARKKAIEASEMKSRFLANMSHEIRTPLNGILGSTTLLMDGAATSLQRELISTLKLSSETLLYIVNDILDFSKIESGKLEVEYRDLDLQALCDDVLLLFRENAEGKGLQLCLNTTPSPLPRIYGDAIRLRQLISNLLSNAIKFTSFGNVDLTVCVNTDTDTGVTISVKDTGTGISIRQQKGLFKAFTQADSSTTRKYGGTGLGLAICSELAKIMNGSITVESRVGEGSTFTLDLPLSVSEKTPPMSTSLPIRQKQGQGRCIDILLVDDNQINRRTGLRLIESMGCNVFLAESGLEAIEKCRQVDFHMILMDIQMPEMDGVEAMQRIRANSSAPPIVALTAHALANDRDRYLLEGFDEYLDKPLKRDSLRLIIDHLLPFDTGNNGGNFKILTEFYTTLLINSKVNEDFIKLMGNEYEELRDSYSADLAQGCERINSLIGEDWKAIKKIAHSLVSASGYIGADRVKKIMQWFDKDGQQAEPALQKAVGKLAMETAQATNLALLN